MNSAKDAAAATDGPDGSITEALNEAVCEASAISLEVFADWIDRLPILAVSPEADAIANAVAQGIGKAARHFAQTHRTRTLQLLSTRHDRNP